MNKMKYNKIMESKYYKEESEQITLKIFTTNRISYHASMGLEQARTRFEALYIISNISSSML